MMGHLGQHDTLDAVMKDSLSLVHPYCLVSLSLEARSHIWLMARLGFMLRHCATPGAFNYAS